MTKNSIINEGDFVMEKRNIGSAVQIPNQAFFVNLFFSGEKCHSCFSFLVLKLEVIFCNQLDKKSIYHSFKEEK
jgi:hypothetical protein